MQAVVGLTHLQLQLAQAIGVALAGFSQLVLGLGQGGAALETDQLVIEPQGRRALAQVGLDGVPAIGLHQKRGAGRIEASVVAPDGVGQRALAEGAAYTQAQLGQQAAAYPIHQTSPFGQGLGLGGQVGIVAERQGQGLLQAQAHPPRSGLQLLPRQG